MINIIHSVKGNAIPGNVSVKGTVIPGNVPATKRGGIAPKAVVATKVSVKYSSNLRMLLDLWMMRKNTSRRPRSEDGADDHDYQSDYSSCSDLG